MRELRRTEETLAVSQGQLALGLRTEITVRDPRFYAMTVYQEILGSSPIAKLMMNVREKHSLCYSCSSAYNAYKGSVLILCGLKNESREKAEREILRQVEDIANGQISDAELAGALASLENAYRRIEDSPSAMEQYYYGRALAAAEISPEELRLPDYIKQDILEEKGLEYLETESLEEVMPELDILYMTRVQRERFFNEEDYLRLRDSYILTPDKLSTAKSDLSVMHPLPRVNEISTAVDADPRACYFRQALNGKYIRMALILALLGL